MKCFSSVQQGQPEPGINSCELLGGPSPGEQTSRVRQTHAHELQCHSRPVPHPRYTQRDGEYASLSPVNSNGQTLVAIKSTLISDLYGNFLKLFVRNAAREQKMGAVQPNE